MIQVVNAYIRGKKMRKGEKGMKLKGGNKINIISVIFLQNILNNLNLISYRIEKLVFNSGVAH